MAKHKNYNPQALRGDTNYTDEQWQADMRQAGIEVPDDVLHTPQLHVVVADQVRLKSIAELPNHMNPETGERFTPDEAKAYADETHKNVLAKMSALSGTKLK